MWSYILHAVNLYKWKVSKQASPTLVLHDEDTLPVFENASPNACDYTCCIRVSEVALLQSDRHRMTTGELDPQGLGGEADTEPDQDNKYVKRTGSVKRSLQRVMPAIFQPTLPVTTRYTVLASCTIPL